MARYRFAWANLPPGVITKLAKGLTIDGEPSQGLMRRYGTRPKTIFIEQAWPILLKAWLPGDDVSRESLSQTLRALGLGRQDIDIDTRQGQLTYLASCRNASTLRSTALSVFLIAGEPAQLRPPKPPFTVQPGAVDVNACTGTGGEVPSLDDWILATIKGHFGPEVRRDPDGDIPLPRGSTILFIRRHDGKSPYLELFAPLLSGFRSSPGVFEFINSLNTQAPLAKVIVNTDESQIILQATLLTDLLSAQGLLFAVDLVSETADRFDNLLQTKFGGITYEAE